MGKPKFSRKKYETPSHPWQEDRIKEENELIKKYGLKNKREVWKAETTLRKYRGQARELLAKVGTSDAQSKKESDQLLMHLSRMNILPQNSTLDDVLALETESILSRRLQTLTYLKGLANTPDQARQLISHGHIAIDSKRVTVPGYIVTKEEETEIGYTSDSPLNDLMHPARPRADFKSIPADREIKPNETKKEIVEEKPEASEKEVKKKSEEPSTPEPVEKKEEETIQEPPKEEEKPEEKSVNEKDKKEEDGGN
jgi:small subunit ribosomal protein S4